ncbi:MAG: DUF2161 family putative PD-(D/E)XK-type phosphodiesterase [Rhodobacteraceae bacterium]|nr:DUF2161 family putative PD-(D/E)XK-type phosphodiesterase [Paracoccaceae bacterium]
MREADLYPPVKAYLEGQGYAVKGEVGAADVVALRGDEPPLIVELKTGFSLSLFHQGIDRLGVSDHVYLCVPRPKGKRALRDNLRLARRLGLGVMTVRADGLLEVHADPGPYAPRKNKKKKSRLLREFERLDGDPNAGGATRHGIVTGYRQDALKCAAYLATSGAEKGAIIAKATGVPKATTIMRNNHYGWFQKVEKGVYDLTDDGRKGLSDWGDALP